MSVLSDQRSLKNLFHVLIYLSIFLSFGRFAISYNVTVVAGLYLLAHLFSAINYTFQYDRFANLLSTIPLQFRLI